MFSSWTPKAGVEWAAETEAPKKMHVPQKPRRPLVVGEHQQNGEVRNLSSVFTDGETEDTPEMWVVQGRGGRAEWASDHEALLWTVTEP